MRSLVYRGAALCVVVALAAFVWGIREAKRASPRFDATGSATLTVGGPSHYASEYHAAWGLMAKGKLAEAERLYTELTNKEPSSPYAYSSLASCRAMRGDYAGARQLYKQALRIEPGLVDALFGLGSCDYAEFDYTNAVANYKTALALDENCPEAHWGLAITYACSGRPAEAKIHLDRLRQLVPDSPHVAEIERAIKRSLAEPGAPPNAAPPHR